MKIAIVVNSAWAAYNFRANLAIAMVNVGYEVIFIIPYDDSFIYPRLPVVERIVRKNYFIDSTHNIKISFEGKKIRL